MKALLILFLLAGCSSSFLSKSKEGKTEYAYADVSGKYKFTREHKLSDKKIVTRTQLLQINGGNSKILEKSILVSHLGSVKDKNKRIIILRPEASEFSVWLEGKNYSSKMSIDEKQKSMRVQLNSPESKWQGTSLIPFPKGKYFCFYSQIPECLYYSGILKKVISDKNGSANFYVIWDSYPYIQDQLSGVGSKLFASANLRYDGSTRNTYKFELEVDGQMIAYHFSKSFDLIKVAWISQGITIVPVSEEASLNHDM